MCAEQTETEAPQPPRWAGFFGDGMMMKIQAASLVLFVICAVIIYAAVHVFGFPSSVVDGYFPYADAMFRGVFPYTEKVTVYGYQNVWEYPPLAYVLMFIPRLVSFSPESYHVAYMAFVIVFVLVGVRSVAKIAESVGYSGHVAVVACTVCFFLMAEFVLDRYDVFPMVMTVLALQFFLERRYPLSYLMLALGTLMKLYPLALIPVFFLWHMRREGRTAPLVPTVMALAVMAVGMLAFYPGITQMFEYHSARPLEIESLVANVLEIVYLVIPTDMYMVFSYGSDNIAGGPADFVAGVIGYFAMATLLLAYVSFFLRKGRGTYPTDSSPVSIMLLVVICLVLFGGVFSTQYVLWMAPFVLFSLMVDKRGRGLRLFCLYMLVMAASQLEFLVNFGLFPCTSTISVPGIVILTIRNLLVLLMLRHVLLEAVLPKELK